MSNVVRFSAGLVGDGVKIDAGKILDEIKSRDVNSTGLQSLSVVYIDAEGELKIAFTDSRAEAVMLFERGKKQIIESYQD